MEKWVISDVPVKHKTLCKFYFLPPISSMLSYWFLTGKLNFFYWLEFLSHSTKNCLLNHFSQWISPELKQVGQRVDRDEETWDTRKSSDSVQDSHTSLAVGGRDFNKWWLFFFFSKGGSETDGNTKQLPLFRSSWSFFLCGFSEQLEEVTCCSGKMDKRLIEWPSCRARREDRSGGRVRWISASSHVKTHKQESTMPYFIFFLKKPNIYMQELTEIHKHTAASW